MNAAGTTTRFAHELQAICGPEHVVEEPERLAAYSILGATPVVAVAPGSAEEVAAVLRLANEAGLSVVPAGGMTQQTNGRASPQIDVLLLTERLTGVEHYDPGDLTVGIGAGCTVSQLSQMVARDGLLVAVDPPLPERCTIGGMLATATHGPLRHGYGSVRDFCIGIRFVTGDGRRAKGGGRVVKNVAGYDLMKLLIGSYGTLAVITSASFKLFPAPRQMRTFLAEFATPSEALDFRSRVLRSPLSPMCLELVSPGARQILRPEMSSESWAVCVRAAGSDAVLARYRTELGEAVSREVEGEDERKLWQTLANFAHLATTVHPVSLLLSLTAPLTEMGSLIEMVSSAARANDSDCAFSGRVGVGHLQVALWPKNTDGESQPGFAAAITTICGKLPESASLTIQHCSPEVIPHMTTWYASPTHRESMRAVKNALDPRDILNRGRFLF